MNITSGLKDIIKHMPGQQVYVKQELLNDLRSLNINGNEVDKMLLQKAYIVSEVQIQIEDTESYSIYYLIRPDSIRAIWEKNPNVKLHAKDHELCNQAEAAAIMNLKG